MRLIVIGPLPPPHHGVTISTGLVLANNALRRRFAIEHLDTSDHRSTGNTGKWESRNVGIALRSIARLALRLRGEPGVVYLPLSQGMAALLRDCLYVQVAARRGWTVAVHLRGGEFKDVYERQPRWMRGLLRDSLARVGSVAVMGRSLRWLFDGLVEPERIAVVANGTPDPDINGHGRDPDAAIFLSNLRRRKGVVEAVEAALIVLQEHPSARFRFIGEWEDPTLERALRDRAAPAGDRIQFLPVVTGEDHRSALAEAGLMVFPPIEPEGHPRVVLEGLAAGLPIITTDQGAIRETMVDGQTGFVLQNPAPEQLADRMLRLFRDPELRERMGAAARARYEEGYTQEVADRTLAGWLGDVAGVPAAATARRVLHCLWDGEIGGAERAVYQLVREQMGDPELAPAVLFAQGRGPYWERINELGCPAISLDLPNGRSVGRLRAAASAMRAYDVHHFHSAEPLLMLASSLCRGTVRVYTHRGGTFDYPWRKRVRYAAVGVLLRRDFHGFSGNTRHAGASAASMFGIEPGRLQVTYNGLEFPLLDPGRDASAVRAELGIEGSDFVLGTAAQLKPWKRIDRLIRAVAAIGQGRLRLLVVGDGSERERLEALAAELCLGERVIFVGSQAQVGDFLQVMNAFCLPSMGLESFGNAAVEAMGFGIPTIVFSDGGGTVEHVDPGSTGFVVADEEELVATLRELMNDPGLAEAVGARGRASVRARYTPASAATAYRSLYRSAIGDGPPRRTP